MATTFLNEHNYFDQGSFGYTHHHQQQNNDDGTSIRSEDNSSNRNNNEGCVNTVLNQDCGAIFLPSLMRGPVAKKRSSSSISTSTSTTTTTRSSSLSSMETVGVPPPLRAIPLDDEEDSSSSSDSDSTVSSTWLSVGSSERSLMSSTTEDLQETEEVSQRDDSSLSSPAASSWKKERRFVHFDCSMNTCHETDIVLSEQDIDDLWWQSSEYRDIRIANRTMVLSPQYENNDIDLAIIFEACCAATSTSSGDGSGTNNNNCNKRRRRMVPCTKELLRLCSGEARGLEIMIYPSEMRLCNTSYTAKILRIQNYLVTQAHKMDATQKCDYLAAASRHWTRPTRFMAQIFGYADAAIVQRERR